MPYSNPNQRKAYAKRYYEAHKERLNELDRQRYANRSHAWNKHLINETPEHKNDRLRKMRDYMLQKNYGISLGQYESMLLAQGGVCALCGFPPRSKAGRHAKVANLSVDHCHKTGRVRKLLCVNCNMGLGWMEANLDKAMKYLQES